MRAASLSLRRLAYRASERFRVGRWAGWPILKPALALALTILLTAMVVFISQSKKSAPSPEKAANQATPSVPGDASPPAPSMNPANVAENPKAPGPSRQQNQRSLEPGPNAAAPPEAAKLVEAPSSDNALAEDDATRALRVERVAASLSAVKRIYVESTGDETLRLEVRAAIISALQPGARFAIATSMDDADALLKASVRRDQSNGKVLVIARLVNANGEVIWPVTPRGSGEKYLGSTGASGARIVEDLLATVRELESKRR